MTDQEIVFGIASLMDFRENFSRQDHEGEARYFDARCNRIPDYVAILGRGQAQVFLALLTAVTKGVADQD